MSTPSCCTSIDVLNLVKTQEQVQGEMQEREMQAQQSLVDQAGQFASSPIADPTKNQQLGETSAPGNEAPAQEAGPRKRTLIQ